MGCIQAFPASSPQKQEHLGHFSGSMSNTIHPREGSVNEKKLTQAPEVAPGDPKVPQNERGYPLWTCDTCLLGGSSPCVSQGCVEEQNDTMNIFYYFKLLHSNNSCLTPKRLRTHLLLSL